MSGVITDSLAARLVALNATPHPLDLYSGPGADFYERLVGSDRTEVREVLALARKTRGAVLDVAAGGGRLTIPLVRCGKEVTAVDLSVDMLSHLERSLPGSALVDCVVADMRDFDLERRYGLIVIGATSITLLDRADRFRLYSSVRRHLADRGLFAFTIAGSTAREALTVTEDRTITVEGEGGADEYLYSQQSVEGGNARIINWVHSAELARSGSVTVLTSRLRLLSHETLAAELVEAGFEAPVVHQVRSHVGADILMLETRLDERADGDR